MSLHFNLYKFFPETWSLGSLLISIPWVIFMGYKMSVKSEGAGKSPWQGGMWTKHRKRWGSGCCREVASVVSDSVQPHRRQPTRLPHPWDSPGKNTGVGCHFLLQCMKGKSESEVAQSCPALHDPMDCSLPGSSIHGIFQARVLERGAVILVINA